MNCSICIIHITIFVDILQTTSLKEFTYLFGKAVFDALMPPGQEVGHEVCGGSQVITDSLEPGLAPGLSLGTSSSSKYS